MDKVAGLLSGYPFDVLLGSVHWLGAWRFDDYDVPVADGRVVESRQVDDCWEGYTTALEELAASGACDVLAHPDLIKVAGSRARCARGVVGPHGRGGCLLGHGGRGLLGRMAQAHRRAVPGHSRCCSGSRPTTCRLPPRRTRIAWGRWPIRPTPCDRF